MTKSQEPPQIRLAPSRIWQTLIALAAALVLAHFAAYTVEQLPGSDRLPERATSFFSLDEENNLPTWFSGALLFLVGGATLLAGWASRVQGDPRAWQWFAIAMIPFGLSLDEVAQVHEAFSVPVRDQLGLGGLLYYAWVVPFFGLVALLSLVFLPFLARLPIRTLTFLLLGAGLVFAGGMLLELVEAWWTAGHGTDGTVWFALITIQECMELAGTITALFAVLDYIAGRHPQLALQLEHDSFKFVSASVRPTSSLRNAQPWSTNETT